MSPWTYPAYQRAVGYSFNATKVMQNSDEPVYAEYVYWPLRSSSQPLPFFSEFGSPPFRSHRLLQWRNTSQSLLHYMGPDLAQGGHAGLGSAPVSCRRPYRQPQRSSISRGSI